MALQAKKYGTIAGVFTPSLLTILGVIMYMRLGWVVGEAGLTGAILIILIAHIISVSTGLSISSIATDKRIKTGGIYYILSRSLGLPMGGAIGIAIFIGTALSISLYIIGFCENFLGIGAISDILGMEASINSYQVIGTVVILILVVLAFISTSLVIKTQFIIMGAIALSLISIVTGFILNQHYHPEGIINQPLQDFSPELVFAVFFPAVTGFTAGVAMSGDLKDPRKSIPGGTLMAIFTGLIIYISLAVGFAFFVDRNLLLEDKNFLMKIAWLAPLVIAGIWGATLSSALGGILGGPRILQAISLDRITPKIFSAGYGKNKEPRNALLLTFMIAEAGILIGELNVIARIVSMFYIAAYGFINLSFTLESWASSDFRPSFKVSRWFGIIGFVACFAVMFKIDTMAMILALIIMFALYFFLKQRKLQTELGDVWQSVWSRIIRTTLQKTHQSTLEERNWQPNIILFSGGTEVRPHLVEFGRWLTGKHGLLSNFDLHEDQSAKKLFPENKESLIPETKDGSKGHFYIKLTCNDIYEGIETITNIYGFSGVEPNTVILGWAKQSKDPVRFVQMLHNLSEMNMNILMMDYDKNRGFGNRKHIDIWWRGSGNNGNLALHLMKFIELSNDWRNPRIRLLIVNQNNKEKDKIYYNSSQILENLRINAEIRIINNEVDQKPLYEIIKVESQKTDLIFVGFHEIETGKEEQFVNDTNKLGQVIGTVILIKASNKFKQLKIGLKETIQQNIGNSFTETDDSREVLLSPEMIRLPEKEALSLAISNIVIKYNQCLKSFLDDYISSIINSHKNLLNQFVNIFAITKSREEIENIYSAPGYAKAQKQYLGKAKKLLEDYYTFYIPKQKEILKSGRVFLEEELDSIIKSIPENISIIYHEHELKKNKNDSLSDRWFKFRQRNNPFIKNKIRYHVRFRKLANSILNQVNINIYKHFTAIWETETRNFIKELHQFLIIADKELSRSAKYSNDQQILRQASDTIKSQIDNLFYHLKLWYTSVQQTIINDCTLYIQKVSDQCLKIPVNQHIPKAINTRKAWTAINYREKEWHFILELQLNKLLLEVMLRIFFRRIESISSKLQSEIINKHKLTILNQIAALKEELIEQHSKFKENPSHQAPTFKIEDGYMIIKTMVNDAIDNLYRKLTNVAQKFPEKIELPKEITESDGEVYSNRPESFEVSHQRLLEHLTQSELLEPLQVMYNEFYRNNETIMGKIKDLIRLINFNLNRKTSITEKEISDEQVFVFIGEQIDKLVLHEKNLAGLQEKLSLEFESIINIIYDKLSLRVYTAMAVDLRRYVREHYPRKSRLEYRQKINKIKLGINKQVEKLWYRQSEGILFAQKQISIDYKETSKIDELSQLTDKCTLPAKISEKLPFYYKQLFLSKQQFHNEFFHGREKEVQQAANVVMKYKHGGSASILITGEPQSGKTFLSQYIATAVFEDASYYTLSPPSDGSMELSVFKSSFASLFGSEEKPENILQYISHNTVIIIDELELWWEKSPSGFEIIDYLIDLIIRYGNRCFFIIDVNTYSYHFINRIKQINQFFTTVINCNPFTARELKEIILLRHLSGGFQLNLNKKGNDTLFPWDYARLFNDYFKYTQGNVGFALQSWINHIEDFDGNAIYSKSPHLPELESMKKLDLDWYLYLTLITIHKRVTAGKLMRISNESEKNIKYKIFSLLQTGLIIEKSSGIYVINPNISLFINSILRQKQYI